MLNSTNAPTLTNTVEQPKKEQWVSPSFEKIEIRLGKLGGGFDELTENNDFES